MDDLAMARWRMRTLRLAGQPYPDGPAVVGGLLAVQAENHAQALWAVATRTPGTTEAELARRFDAGDILRTHVLRSTWHYVLPDDIRWLEEVTAPRVRPTFAAVQRQLGLDDATLERAVQAIVDALAGGSHLTRADVGERLRDRGLPAEGQRLGVMLASAELAGLVCSGAMAGTHHTYALVDERAPGARRLPRDEALAELALRYVAGHGPATERDLAYWATLTLTDVRAGLAAVADRLDRVDQGGRTYWVAPPQPDDAPLLPRAHLLQILDESYRGYQDSRDLIDVAGIEPRGRAAAIGMVLVDGQMTGHMRRTVRSGEVVFDVAPFRALAADEREALEEAADRYGHFLDLPARVVVAGGR